MWHKGQFFELAKQLNLAKQEQLDSRFELAGILKTLGGLLGLLQLDPAVFLQGGDDSEVAIIEHLFR